MRRTANQFTHALQIVARERALAVPVNATSQVARTFRTNDWWSVARFVAFASSFARELSNLSTADEVTLTAMSEPVGLPRAVGGLGTLIRQCLREMNTYGCSPF